MVSLGKSCSGKEVLLELTAHYIMFLNAIQIFSPQKFAYQSIPVIYFLAWNILELWHLCFALVFSNTGIRVRTLDMPDFP